MVEYRLLGNINSPADVKALPFEELDALCAEIRTELIRVVSKNGGHLASNLGTVELTVALHRVFDSPNDQIVWDVGHQSYTHKLLTGRREQFSTIRLEGGLSGFPKSRESEHDAFIAGHSSTSISAAAGLAKAKQLNGDPHRVIAIAGDGALTGGMIYEGLNNAGRACKNLIVILNDNKMSISHNVGALARYLTLIRSKPRYFKLKDDTMALLSKLPLVGNPLKKAAYWLKRKLKAAIYSSNLFEDLGFDYLGPIDGHDLTSLCDVLSRAATLQKPAFIHVRTVKGKGYPYAELDPAAFHGTPQFDVATGNPEVEDGDSFSQAFGEELCRMAQEDSHICAVTAAMKYGTGLQMFAASYRDRFFDVGIAEEHAVTFCAGLSAGGYRPVFAVYSSFLQRAYDQLLHDVSIENNRIVLCIDRAGVVGADGETHQGLYDVSFLTSIPGIHILAPSTFAELRACLRYGVYDCPRTCAVRYPKGGEPERALTYTQYDATQFGLLSQRADTLFISYGRAADAFVPLQEALGKQADFLKLVRLFPFPEGLVQRLLHYRRIVFVEESAQNGSIGEHLLRELNSLGYRGAFFHRALGNEFLPQSSVKTIFQEYGLDAVSLLRDWEGDVFHAD